MKVLYNILNPYGLGADRWVYEGFKSAFTAAGHQVFPTTEVDDFRKSAEMVNPEILFLDFHALIDYCRKV
ncbi:MAG TPA: hypothetical protein VMT81_01525, partial [Candidatus Paceibacterota bacterium]|nr:hypothetical protein [Candidatus Paceibacterota bacterium]